MSELETRFQQAAADAPNLPERPSNEDLLELYALYKQGSSGDAGGDRPGMMDFVKRAKYDAWAGLKGMTRETAMQQYIAKIDKLKG